MCDCLKCNVSSHRPNAAALTALVQQKRIREIKIIGVRKKTKYYISWIEYLNCRCYGQLFLHMICLINSKDLFGATVFIHILLTTFSSLVSSLYIDNCYNIPTEKWISQIIDQAGWWCIQCNSRKKISFGSYYCSQYCLAGYWN